LCKRIGKDDGAPDERRGSVGGNKKSSTLDLCTAYGGF